MFLYWSIFLLLLLFSFIEQSRGVSNTVIRRLFYIAVVFLFSLSFMRWERGTDWPAYYSIFMNKGVVGEWNTHTELGYLTLNRIVSSFTDSYTIFLFVWEGLYYVLFVYICNKINALISKKTKLRCYFPILLYCFCIGFAGMFAVRSTFAYLLCFIGLLFVFEKKYAKFVITVLIASSFHLSALLFLIVFPLTKLTLNKISISLIIVGGVLFFQLSEMYSSILTSINFGDYTEYLRGEERMSMMGMLKWGFVVMMLLIIRPQGKTPIYMSVVSIVLFGVVIYVWSQFFSPVAQRLSELFTQVAIIWIAMVFCGLRKELRVASLFVMAFFCGISLWSLLNSGYKDLYVPYKFFWDTFNVEVF